MKTVRDQVLEFHEMAWQPIVETPQVPSDERVRLRARIILEECIETLAAMFDFEGGRATLKLLTDKAINFSPVKVDMVALANGLADLDYVVEGTRIEFGIDGGPVADEVHAANMRKKGGNKRADGKITKPEGWVGPDIEGVLTKQGWRK